jgi:hypothetical protein
MLREYVQAAMSHAKYEILPDDGSCYGEIPECRGVYANAATLEACREELREVSTERFRCAGDKRANAAGRNRARQRRGVARDFRLRFRASHKIVVARARFM